MKPLVPLLLLFFYVTACLDSADPPTQVPIIQPPSETDSPTTTVSPRQNPTNSEPTSPTWTTTDSDSYTTILAEKCLPMVIDRERFDNTPTHPFRLLSAHIQNHCLSISIEYLGGCTAAVGELLDAGDIMESDPLQRNLRFVLQLDDSWESLIRQEFLFDIKPTQMVDDKRIYLRFRDFDLRLLYSY